MTERRLDNAERSDDNDVGRASLGFMEELARTAFVEPVVGAKQLANQLTGHSSELAQPHAAHEDGLVGTFKQAGAIVGSTLPLIGLSILTRRFLPTGKAATFLATAAGGFTYDMVTHPVYGDQDYWSAKLANAGTTSLTLGTMSTFAPTLKLEGTGRLAAAARGGYSGFGSGLLGGVVNAEASSIFSGHGLATPENTFKSAISFGLLGGALGAAGGAAFGDAPVAARNSKVESTMAGKPQSAELHWFRRTKPNGEMEPSVGMREDGSMFVLDNGRAASFRDGRWQDGVKFSHEEMAEFTPVRKAEDVSRVVASASNSLETSYGALRQTFLQEVEQHYAPEAQAKIKDALLVAEDAHLTQLRKPHVDTVGRPDPYIIHPLRSARILMNEMGQRDPAAIQAALLHDVIEDSAGRYTMQMISDRFGSNVANMLRYLTKPAANEQITGEQLAAYYSDLHSAPNVVREVKLADRLDNIREALVLPTPSPFQHKYLKETVQEYIPMAARTNPHFFQELDATCRRLAQMLGV